MYTVCRKLVFAIAIVFENIEKVSWQFVNECGVAGSAVWAHRRVQSQSQTSHKFRERFTVWENYYYRKYVSLYRLVYTNSTASDSQYYTNVGQKSILTLDKTVKMC